MAKDVLNTGGVVPIDSVRAGAQILDVITSGMYSNPLMAVREYIQNAVDSLDDAAAARLIPAAKGRVEVEVDGRNRTLTVVDNGTGVRDADVTGVLCSLGISTKRPGSKRGFRGIGRLGGIGYCDRLVFETRVAGQNHVCIVTWDGRKLRQELADPSHPVDVGSVVRRVIAVARRPAVPGDAAHFFSVRLENVHRFHKDEIMNVGRLSCYIGQAAPVPFDQVAFPFAKAIEAHLAGVDGYRSYDIRVNGKPIFRPHVSSLGLDADSDTIKGVELLDLRGPEGAMIGRGWYAKTEYLASLPQVIEMRGIRVRQGNLEIGDEYYFAGAFAERRFATWHIGEIHIGYSLRANARRDGFEQSPAHEALLEQAGLLGRHLSQLCRASSKHRSERAHAERMLEKAEGLAGQTFTVDADHREKTRVEIISLLEKLRAMDAVSTVIPRFSLRVETVAGALDRMQSGTPDLFHMFNGRSLRHVDAKTVLQQVAKTIVDHHTIGLSKEDLLTLVLAPYLKSHS